MLSTSRAKGRARQAREDGVVIPRGMGSRLVLNVAVVLLVNPPRVGLLVQPDRERDTPWPFWLKSLWVIHGLLSQDGIASGSNRLCFCGFCVC